MGNPLRPTPPIADRLRRLTCLAACCALAAVLAAPAARASDAVSCPSGDAALVDYDGGEAPFPVLIRQPQGWNTKSVAAGRVVDFYQAENESRSPVLLRFNVLGPMDPSPLVEPWSQADPEEISEVELESGGSLRIRRPQSALAMAILPAADGKAYIVNGAIVHAEGSCKEVAEELLDRIVRGLRPRS
jgi:hypothetical protein